MRIERTVTDLTLEKCKQVQVIATAEASYVVTDEALLCGGEMIEQQIDWQIMRQIRRDAMHALKIDDDIDAALRALRVEVEHMIEALDPIHARLVVNDLDAVFNAAADRMKP